MKLINLGCGKVFHPDWINLDLTSEIEGVISYDIRQKLPFSDNSFDACYSSHVLEHLKISETANFLEECWRILKPNGVLRIVVPDLEIIAKTYINLLQELKSGKGEQEANYDWIMLELYDQVTRYHPGGQMKTYLTHPNLSNKDFILSRIGQEACGYWETLPDQPSLWQKITHKSFKWWLKKSRLILIQTIVKIIGDQDMNQAFQEGIMRNSGEIHRWMYDAFSLQRLLQKNGFINPQICQANQSQIPDFNTYQLDTLEGNVRKPDSLFMEAIKPKEQEYQH